MDNRWRDLAYRMEYLYRDPTAPGHRPAGTGRAMRLVWLGVVLWLITISGALCAGWVVR